MISRARPRANYVTADQACGRRVPQRQRLSQHPRPSRAILVIGMTVGSRAAAAALQRCTSSSTLATRSSRRPPRTTNTDLPHAEITVRGGGVREDELRRYGGAAARLSDRRRWSVPDAAAHQHQERGDLKVLTMIKVAPIDVITWFILFCMLASKFTLCSCSHSLAKEVDLRSETSSLGWQHDSAVRAWLLARLRSPVCITRQRVVKGRQVTRHQRQRSS
jgi:hypothetical protein